MAKAASPIRLQEDLMQAAALTGKRFHRSAEEQIDQSGKITLGKFQQGVFIAIKN